MNPKLLREIAAQHAAVADWLRCGRTVDFFLSLHNTETSEYLKAAPGPMPEIAPKLSDLLMKHTSFHPRRLLFTTEATITAGMRIA